jgi:hypothetical protein
MNISPMKTGFSTPVSKVGDMKRAPTVKVNVVIAAS